MAAEDRVQFVDLARSFGSLEAVRGISLEIHAGETFGLLGPNGAGKTTTLSMLSTLLPPTRGDVLVFGASAVGDPAEVRRRVGLAPQQISLYPTFTAAGEPGLLRHAPRRAARRPARARPTGCSSSSGSRRDATTAYTPTPAECSGASTSPAA